MRAFAFLLLLAGAAAGQGIDIAALVDLPARKERRAAARRASSRARLEELLQAMARFRPRGDPPEPGLHTETVPVAVLGRVDRTEITFYVPERYRPGRPAPLLMAFHGSMRRS